MIAYALLAVFVVIQVLDVWTTAAALKGGAEEAMPLGSILFAKIGFWPGVAFVKGLAFAAAILATLYVSNAAWFTGTLCLIGVYVLWHNWRVLKRQG